MSTEYKFKQGDVVTFPLHNGSHIDGKIVGVAAISQAVIGATYIVDASDYFPNETYPFTHIPVFEVHLTKV